MNICMNILCNRIYIILLMIILSGCDKSPPQPDTWEKMMANTMGVPQNSWRLHTSMRGRIRIIYIFQTDQQWTDCIHLQALKLQDGLDAKVSYSGISTDNILDISGLQKKLHILGLPIFEDIYLSNRNPNNRAVKNSVVFLCLLMRHQTMFRFLHKIDGRMY